MGFLLWGIYQEGGFLTGINIFGRGFPEPVDKRQFLATLNGHFMHNCSILLFHRFMIDLGKHS